MCASPAICARAKVQNACTRSLARTHVNDDDDDTGDDADGEGDDRHDDESDVLVQEWFALDG